MRAHAYLPDGSPPGPRSDEPWTGTVNRYPPSGWVNSLRFTDSPANVCWIFPTEAALRCAKPLQYPTVIPIRVTKELLRSVSLVSRPTGTMGRVVESAGTRTQRTLSHPRPKLSTRGVDRVVADDLQTLCLGLERVVPFVSNQPCCLDTYELLNNSSR